MTIIIYKIKQNACLKENENVHSVCLWLIMFFFLIFLLPLSFLVLFLLFLSFPFCFMILFPPLPLSYPSVVQNSTNFLQYDCTIFITSVFWIFKPKLYFLIKMKTPIIENLAEFLAYGKIQTTRALSPSSSLIHCATLD